MARVKISEFTAKSILISGYSGLVATTSTSVEDIKSKFGITNLVVKVDQGIKKRGKQGLVKVNVSASEIPDIIKLWSQLKWSNFLIEPVVEHDSKVEHYLALERVRDGWQISYSEHGGIEVESSWDSVTRTVLSPKGDSSTGDLAKGQVGTAKLGGVSLLELITPLIPLLDANHISFLEMNPVVVRGDKIIPLDMACEVDSAGSILPTIQNIAQSDSEKSVAILDTSTPASLKFKLLNPNGSIWVFLSGGGASLVIADEVADVGLGKELANYGEYSGSPSDDDVYSYAKIILAQLLRAVSRKPLAIIIAGGVANFTDVASTFRGLIRALEEKKTELVSAKVKIFVRRGGPNEVKGLKLMTDFLTRSNLLGSVHGHDFPLTGVVTEVCDYLGSDPNSRTVLALPGDSSTGDLSKAQVGTPKVGGVSRKVLL